MCVRFFRESGQMGETDRCRRSGTRLVRRGRNDRQTRRTRRRFLHHSRGDGACPSAARRRRDNDRSRPTRAVRLFRYVWQTNTCGSRRTATAVMLNWSIGFRGFVLETGGILAPEFLKSILETACLERPNTNSLPQNFHFSSSNCAREEETVCVRPCSSSG